MSALFSSPDTPALPEPAPVISEENGMTKEQMAEAKKKERLEAAKRKGRAASIVTGSTGDTSEAEIKRATLG